MSAARAFLKPVKNRDNLTIITNAHATEILLDGKRATGITYCRGGAKGKIYKIHAAREAIIFGGTINRRICCNFRMAIQNY